MRTHGATLLAAALVLVAAAPASAVTGGFGIADGLRGKTTALLAASEAGQKGKSRRSSCEAGKPPSTKTSALATELGRQIAPVACEQPPRSEVIPPDAFDRARAAMLAVIG
jgi:hypothetical protein